MRGLNQVICSQCQVSMCWTSQNLHERSWEDLRKLKLGKSWPSSFSYHKETRKQVLNMCAPWSPFSLVLVLWAWWLSTRGCEIPGESLSLSGPGAADAGQAKLLSHSFQLNTWILWANIQHSSMLCHRSQGPYHSTKKHWPYALEKGERTKGRVGRFPFLSLINFVPNSFPLYLKTIKSSLMVTARGKKKR